MWRTWFSLTPAKDAEADWVASALAGVHYVELPRRDWRAAAKLGRDLAARDHLLPLSDLALAVAAQRHQHSVYSIDPHFDFVPNLNRYSPDDNDGKKLLGDPMIEPVTLEELRQTRRKLAEEQGNDPQRYAAMLAEVSRTLPGTYVKQPLLPQVPTDGMNGKGE